MDELLKTIEIFINAFNRTVSEYDSQPAAGSQMERSGLESVCKHQTTATGYLPSAIFFIQFHSNRFFRPISKNHIAYNTGSSTANKSLRCFYSSKTTLPATECAATFKSQVNNTLVKLNRRGKVILRNS